MNGLRKTSSPARPGRSRSELIIVVLLIVSTLVGCIRVVVFDSRDEWKIRL